MKKIMSLMLLLAAIIIFTVCFYLVYLKTSFKTLRCDMSISYDVMWDKIDYFSVNNKTDTEQLFFIIDKKHKRLLNLDKKPIDNINVDKLDKNYINFARTQNSKIESFSIDLKTGVIEGVGSQNDEFGSTTYLYKGECKPYKPVNL